MLVDEGGLCVVQEVDWLEDVVESVSLEVAAFEVYSNWGQGLKVVSEVISALALEEVKVSIWRWLVSHAIRNGLPDP